MTKLLPIFLLSLFLAYCAEKNSVYEYDDKGYKRYIKKDKFFFFLLFLLLAIFVGLRTAYNDTYAYTYSYELMGSKLSELSEISYSIGDNPGFHVMNIILKSLKVSTQSFLMIYSLITNGIYLWFIRKYSNHYFVSIFLFSTMGIYTFTMAAIKQCVAVAFCLVATDRAIQKKYYNFIFWLLIAITFHPYSLMYVVVPFLSFIPWTVKTYSLLVVFALLGLGLENLLGSVINITTLLGEEFDISSFTGEGVNILRLAVVWVPVILSFIGNKLISSRNSKRFNILMNLSMLNAEIMFIALFGTANYFARLANYFLLFQCISLPELLENFNKASKNLIKFFMFACFLLYFYYSNGLYGGFDANFRSIKLIEYLKSLF